MRIIKRLVLAWLAFSAAAFVGAFVVRKTVVERGDESSDEFSLVAAIDGREFASSADHFTSGEALAVMGGIELDLADAKIESSAILTLRAVMGGIEVVVPQSWRVELRAKALMGGIENLTDPDAADDDAPLLLVDADACMGGIVIHALEAADAG